MQTILELLRQCNVWIALLIYIVGIVTGVIIVIWMYIVADNKLIQEEIEQEESLLDET